MTPEQFDKLVTESMVRAQYGTPQCIDFVEKHMKEYFEKWPNYKNKLTSLEWYHLFADAFEAAEKYLDQHRVSACKGNGGTDTETPVVK